MLKRLRSILLSSVLGLTAFVMSGCGGDSSGGTTGPAAGSSFSGTSISFNPTINFTTGTDLTYLNNEVGSPFPAAAVATPGTYTYVPNASFTSGTLTLTVDGITPPIVLEIGSFTQSGGNVTGFSIRYNGQSYPTTVTGTLAAYQRPSGGGGGGAGETRADDIPSSMQGTYQLTFFNSDTPPVTGVPADGTVTTFTLAARTLVVGGRTLSNPVFYQGNEFEWLFKDGTVTYAASISPGGGLNEINIYPPVGTAGFYGQYREAAVATVSGGKPTSGTFTGKVSSVYPTNATAYAVGETETFTFGATTLDFDGVTYTFVDSNEFAANYSATVGMDTYIVRVGIESAGASTYVTYFNAERPGMVSYFFKIVP